MAVDQEDGRVFVGDPLSGVVDVFDSSGHLLTALGGAGLEVEALGIAVDEASGDVYVADEFTGDVLVFKPTGPSSYAFLSEWSGEALPAKGFGEVTGVAVDNSKGGSAGDVYVVDAEDASSGEAAIDVFKPKPAGSEEAAEGDLLRQISSPQMEEPNGVAVSRASGTVLVADSVKGTVFKFSAAGVAEGKFNGKGSPQGTFLGPEEEEGNVSAIALDETSGDILVAEAERRVVSEFTAGGEWVGWITSTPRGPSRNRGASRWALPGRSTSRMRGGRRRRLRGPERRTGRRHRQGLETRAYERGAVRHGQRRGKTGPHTTSSGARAKRSARAALR